MARRGEAAGREPAPLRAVPAPGKCCTEERGHLVLLEVQPLDVVGR